MSEQREVIHESARDPALPPDKPNVGLHRAVCPVIGLGASAGGLEAFQNFLSATPADAGLAFVLVQHLDPNHESMLAELLGRRTEMPVLQIEDGMPIEPNRVYLIPPNASLAIQEARLKLSQFSEPRGFRRPIDAFFRSLALDQGSNSACVVLSGTGGDGSEGLRAVKEAGGLTLVQTPESAKYDGMPKSAVATGLVDQVLAVREMPEAIRSYFERNQGGSLALPNVDEFLKRVYQELRFRLGHDFSQYKRSTVLRRIERRTQVLGTSTGAEYLARLHASSDEATLLFRDLLINVTSFFRDPETFDILRTRVIPELLKDKGAGDTVRVWTPGCSSGEEAYSIAILFAEALAAQPVKPTVQIFATDIDEQMLTKAREASYPHTVVRDVPPELLDRYFMGREDEYILTPGIRDIVRVSSHNLIKDPPFSRLDLVCCRNLLIYLTPELQQRLIPLFHYALKPEGWLFLGSAENIAGRDDLFDTAELAAKIYRRKDAPRQALMSSFVSDTGLRSGREHPVGRDRSDVDRGETVSRHIMDRYAPAHVVVNADNDIIYSSARTGKFLELSKGPPSPKITDLARRGLRVAVRSALDGARRSRKPVSKRDLRVTLDEEQLVVDVSADPLSDGEVLLVFRELAGVRKAPDVEETDVQVDDYTDDDRIKELEDELDELRSKLRTTVEELETSNEELKSSNEEMMSMNEELQSTNEELSTVNEELKNKVDEIARANSDLQNFLESTQIATIFLDRSLRIRSFTPATRNLFRFQDQDKGRPLADVVSRVDQQQIEGDSRSVLATGTPVQREIELTDHEQHETYLLRVLPYRDLAGTVDGVVLTFADMTEIREAKDDLLRKETIARERRYEIETLYKTAPVGMALIDRGRQFVKINQHFADINRLGIDEHTGRTLGEIAPHLADAIEMPISEVFQSAQEVVNVEVSVDINGDGAPRDFLFDFYPYRQDERVTAVGLIAKDVTELRHLERELRRLMDELQHRVKNMLATVASIVQQTVRTKVDRSDLIAALKSRIGALAATHNLLTARDWRDVSLRKILQGELVPYRTSGNIELEGPDVALPPKHALTMTMTVHELATNAAKYGALSVPEGHLKVEWIVNVDANGRRLILEWTESGGPQPQETPRESFGSQLIKGAVAYDLQGSSELQLLPDGARCRLAIPF
jgi:two-component system CheB/CheR fusion protein